MHIRLRSVLIANFRKKSKECKSNGAMLLYSCKCCLARVALTYIGTYGCMHTYVQSVRYGMVLGLVGCCCCCCRRQTGSEFAPPRCEQFRLLELLSVAMLNVCTPFGSARLSVLADILNAPIASRKNFPFTHFHRYTKSKIQVRESVHPRV